LSLPKHSLGKSLILFIITNFFFIYEYISLFFFVFRFFNQIIYDINYSVSILIFLLWLSFVFYEVKFSIFHLNGYLLFIDVLSHQLTLIKC
jgi:hypothetical protein